MEKCFILEKKFNEPEKDSNTFTLDGQKIRICEEAGWLLCDKYGDNYFDFIVKPKDISWIEVKKTGFFSSDEYHKIAEPLKSELLNNLEGFRNEITGKQKKKKSELILENEKVKKMDVLVKYKILYKSEEFEPEDDLVLGIPNPTSPGDYIDYIEDSYYAEPFKDSKDSDIKNNNNEYDTYENRSAIFRLEYKESLLRKLNELKIFQFDQDASIGDGFMPKYDSDKIGKLETVEVLSLSKTRKNQIISFLTAEQAKLTVSDIDFRLEFSDNDATKILCEELFRDGKISRTSNYRYFVKTEEKTISKNKSKKVDMKSELKKMKELVEEGLISQEDYDKKKKKLLGI